MLETFVAQLLVVIRSAQQRSGSTRSSSACGSARQQIRTPRVSRATPRTSSSTTTAADGSAVIAGGLIDRPEKQPVNAQTCYVMFFDHQLYLKFLKLAANLLIVIKVIGSNELIANCCSLVIMTCPSFVKDLHEIDKI